jgi:hypothetical protein
MVKIDVEGFEPSVFKGAESLLRDHNVWFIATGEWGLWLTGALGGVEWGARCGLRVAQAWPLAGVVFASQRCRCQHCGHGQGKVSR